MPILEKVRFNDPRAVSKARRQKIKLKVEGKKQYTEEEHK